MGKLFISISILMLVVLSINLNAQVYTISGKVEQTFPYCGGAPPSQEMLDKMAKPKAFANKTFYVRKGKKNNIKKEIVAQFTSDSNGVFSIELPKGVYSVLVEEQVEKIEAKAYTTQNQSVDEKCLQSWWKKPYFLLCVKSDRNDLKFLFNHRCYIKSDNPCISYTGPKHP